MAGFIHKPGTGSLLQNGKKTTEKHPDYRGEIVLDRECGAGTVLKIAGWKSENKFGGLIKIRLDQQQDADKQWPKKVDDNDIPF
jgi:hypothetical protein